MPERLQLIDEVFPSHRLTSFQETGVGAIIKVMNRSF